MTQFIKMIVMMLMVGLLLISVAAPASAAPQSGDLELQACWSNSCPPELKES